MQVDFESRKFSIVEIKFKRIGYYVNCDIVSYEF